MKPSPLDKLAIGLHAYLDRLEQQGIIGKILKRVILLILIIIGLFVGGLLLFVLPIYLVIMIQELKGTAATLFALGVAPVQLLLARVYERSRSFWALLFSVILMIGTLFKSLSRFGTDTAFFGTFPLIIFVTLAVISWDPSAPKSYRTAYLVLSVIFNAIIMIASVYLLMVR